MGACDSKEDHRCRKGVDDNPSYTHLRYTQGTIKDKAEDKLRVTSSLTITDEKMEVDRREVV